MSEPHYFNMENDELKRTFAAQLHQLVSAALPYDETPRPEYYVDTKAVADALRDELERLDTAIDELDQALDPEYRKLRQAQLHAWRRQNAS
jgi:monoamine oxidase